MIHTTLNQYDAKYNVKFLYNRAKHLMTKTTVPSDEKKLSSVLKITLLLCRRPKRQEQPEEESPWQCLNPLSFYLISKLGTSSNLDDEPSEVLTKPATSAHVSDVVRMAFRMSNM